MEFESEYIRMRERYLRVREQESTGYASYPMAPERLVRCVWYDGLYDAQLLRTLAGKPVEVLSQGEWNLQDGPDFLDALVRIGDSAPRRGDVEIHVRTGDWRRHGHHENERYNSVVLHVALWRDTGEDTTPLADGATAPTVTLLSAIHEDIWDLASRIDMENYPFSSDSRVGACHAAALEHPDSLEKLLRMAGRERLYAKARRCARELTKFNEDEVLYRGFMEGLGYRPNKHPFRKLAERLPLKSLRPLILATSPEKRSLVLQSVFLGVSGLTDNIPVTLWDEETLKYFRKLKDFWDSENNPFSGTKRLRKTEWTIRGVRPANFPVRRIIGMCNLLAATGGLPGRPVHAFREMLRVAANPRVERAALEALLDSIAQESGGFWEHRASAGAARGARTPAFIGRPLARALVLNIALPVLICRARRDRDQPLTQAALSLYDNFPRLDMHQISRIMTHRLWGPGENAPPPRREIAQQGLLQIFFDFCEENVRDCNRCAFPSMIRDEAASAAQ